MSSTNKSQYKCESCIEWYDDGPRIPKEFPCHHNICALCVLQLMGESPKMNSGNTIPLGRSISCPICDSQFVSDDITTNSDLASKITALIGLESLILTDPDVKEPQKPKTKLTDIKPKTEKNDQLDPQPTEPNPYSEPYPSEPPPPLPEPQPSEPKPSPEDPQPSEPKPSPDPQPSEPEPSPDSHPSEPKHSPEPQPSKPHPLSPKIKPSSFDIDPEPPSGFQTPNSQAWNVHPLPYLQPQGPDGYPQYDLSYQEPQQNFAGAQGLGWTTPTMAPPPPPANTPLVEDGDQFRIGWSFPVGPQLDQSYPASPFVGMPQPMTQTMPQPYGSNPDDSHLSGYYQQ